MLVEKTMFECHVNLFAYIIIIYEYDYYNTPLQSGTIWK